MPPTTFKAMDIRNINSGSNIPADRLRPDSGNKVDQVEEVSPVENDPEDASTSTPQDRVEISDAGQMASVDGTTGDVMELRMARQAMVNLPPLGADRIAEVRDRIGTGYYSQPEQIRSTAEGIVRELFGAPPADATGQE